MQLLNSTRMATGFTMGVQPGGRESLVVVVKATYRIPSERGAKATLHEEQAPLIMSDEFFGDPGLSAPKYEVDFAPSKPRCDVLLNGTAYAPNERAVDRVPVGLRVGEWTKVFDVVGDRFWFTAGGVRSTSAKPFVSMPITYDRAFGGADLRHEDPGRHAAFMPNPSGRGFHKHLIPEWLEGSPLPNTEQRGAEISAPDGDYRPMSFGPVGRHWEPRYRFAGTYDQNWLDNVAPFLPDDFDDRYYQAAPLDQQIPKPVGELGITLLNLTLDGRRDFVLPCYEAPLCFFPKKSAHEAVRVQADTIVIEPDLERLTVTWRCARPLKRNMFEVSQVLVGHKTPAWWRARRTGKKHYVSLAALLRDREQASAEE